MRSTKADSPPCDSAAPARWHWLWLPVQATSCVNWQCKGLPLLAGAQALQARRAYLQDHSDRVSLWSPVNLHALRLCTQHAHTTCPQAQPVAPLPGAPPLEAASCIGGIINQCTIGQPHCATLGKVLSTCTSKLHVVPNVRLTKLLWHGRDWHDFFHGLTCSACCARAALGACQTQQVHETVD